MIKPAKNMWARDISDFHLSVRSADRLRRCGIQKVQDLYATNPKSEPGWYGLLSPEGHRLTPPSFLSIKAVDKDLYLCETTHGNGRLLNSRGQEVE